MEKIIDDAQVVDTERIFPQNIVKNEYIHTEKPVARRLFGHFTNPLLVCSLEEFQAMMRSSVLRLPPSSERRD